MIILITWGGEGIQNWAKVDYLICARSLTCDFFCGGDIFYLEMSYVVTIPMTTQHNLNTVGGLDTKMTSRPPTHPTTETQRWTLLTKTA